jgi:hypothetical protein
VSAIRVSLANENPAYAGVVSFDGQVVEAVGFADTMSQRLPIEIVDEVELEDSMLHVLSNPVKGDSYGIELPVKPSDEERAALQELADAILSAAGAGG